MRRVVIVLLALSLAACGGPHMGAQLTPRPTPIEHPLTVITTAYPLFEAVSDLGGPRVSTVNLLPVSAFANAPLTGEQRARLMDADVVVTLGKGTQPAVDAALTGRRGLTLDVLDGLPVQGAAPGQSGEASPFVWLDPELMARLAQEIQGALEAKDPGAGLFYQSRAVGLRVMLARVDRNYAHTLARCEHKDLVTEEPSFGYLAQRYGLDQVRADPFDTTTVDGVIATYHPTTFFAPGLPSSRDARALLQEKGVRVGVLDSLENRTDQARRGGANYESVMRLNLMALSAALGCADTDSYK